MIWDINPSFTSISQGFTQTRALQPAQRAEMGVTHKSLPPGKGQGNFTGQQTLT